MFQLHKDQSRGFLGRDIEDRFRIQRLQLRRLAFDRTADRRGVNVFDDLDAILRVTHSSRNTHRRRHRFLVLI